MSFNSFDYYKQLRQYQLHMQKLSNPETQVPTHNAFKPPKPQLQRVRQYQRHKKNQQIQHQNQHILSKLVKINRGRSDVSKSSPNLILPKIKKEFNIPQYEQENNIIAKKIIESKARVNSISNLSRNRSIETTKRNISKFVNQDGVVINRKKYLAELMLLKKMRMSEVMKTNRQ